MPTVFGDETLTNTAAAASWIAVAISGLTMIGGVANLLINKWADRNQASDKLVNETEKVELRAKVTILEERQKDCLEGHRHVADQLKRCEEEHASSNADRSRIWAELYALKSGTTAGGVAAGRTPGTEPAASPSPR